MDKFGPYELAEQIDLAGYVWTARKAPGSPAQFVVRFRENRSQEIRAAAELQKALADAAAPGWAPVHAVGDAPQGGAFYATDAYPWSAELCFEQKDRVSSLHLLKLCDALCAALERVQTLHGRGHGNLKLSNVLLTSRDLALAKAFLSDPAPLAAEPIDDRRGLGRIIFELVTGTAFRDYYWPVVTSEKWSELGPDGPRWLDWCNRLLAPADQAATFSIAEFARELDSIRPAPTLGERVAALPWKRISAVAAVLAVILTGAAVGWHLYQQAKLRAAMLAAHQEVDQRYVQFTDWARKIETTAGSAPELQAALLRADLLDSAHQRDEQLDLTGVHRIGDLPPLRDQAIASIAAMQSQWTSAAFKTLSSQRFKIGDIDEAVQKYKYSSDPDTAAQQAAHLIAAMSRLAAAWPGPADPLFRVSAVFGDIAIGRIIDHPDEAAQAVDGFTSDLQGQARGEAVPTAISDAGLAIAAERQISPQLLDQLKQIAPRRLADLYNDLATDAPTVPFESNQRTLPGIDKWRQDSIQLIRQTRLDEVKRILAKLQKVTFNSIQPLNDGVARYFSQSAAGDPQATLRGATILISSFDTLSRTWPKPVAIPPTPGVTAADRDGITAAYLDHLASAERGTVQSVMDNPDSAARAAALLNQTKTQLDNAAVVVNSQFRTAAAARAHLADGTYPPLSVAEWEQIKSDLADAATPVPGWPDPKVADPAAKVADVLSALASQDVNQLHGFARSAGSPALLSAVCVKWPAIHSDDPQADFTFYQDLIRGLNKLPASTAKSLSDLWTGRLSQAADGAGADALWNLALKMGLDKQDPGPPTSYVNDRLKFLQARYPTAAKPDRKAAIDEFVARTDSYDKWALTASELQSLSDFRDNIQAKFTPGNGKLPSKAFFRAAPGEDVVYTPPFDPNMVMRFKLLRNKAGGSCYFCTTEVPVGWFIDLAAEDHAPIFRRLMDVIRPQKLAGPSTWAPDGDWIKVYPDWIVQTEVLAPWAAQLNVAPASPVKPMQYVSPLAAMEAARLVGCRLPTVDEWREAFNSPLRDNDDNTGGSNWQALRATISAITTDPGPATVGLEKFKAELPLAGPAAPAANPNDQLWFRDVPRDYPTFHDLRGNVAEWVLTAAPDEPAPVLLSDNPITVVDEAGSHVVTSQDASALKTFYTHVSRIGLSTTSGSNEDETTPRIPDDPLHNHRHQYFDVGFRLVLSDTPDDPAKFIAEAIGNERPLAP